VNDDPPKLLSRRRVLIIGGGLGGFTLALGWGWLGLRAGGGHQAHVPTDITPAAKMTVLAFIGALFGRHLSEQDLAELSDRLSFRLSSDATFTDECTVLVQYLDRFASEQGASTFRSCSDFQKESTVQRIVSIDSKSVMSKVLRRLSTSQRNYYRMRWSTLWQLSWLYSQSGAARRARGYARWPGIPGDWREILLPGPAYP
jgi:hypothetical protein